LLAPLSLLCATVAWSVDHFVSAGAMIEAASATLLYLPPYSPALNSIEHSFSKFLKVILDA
jgi:DDE superfamily endonuclease